MQHKFSSVPVSVNWNLVLQAVLILLFAAIISTTSVEAPDTRTHTHKGPKPKALRSRTLELSEVEITCTVANYPDGTTCFNGTVPPNISELSQQPWHIEKTALWYSVDNKDNVGRVRAVEKQCSDSCASKTCYYSLKRLDYICGSNTSEEYYVAQKAIYDLEEAHFEYQLYTIGMICWTGELSGVVYDEFKTNSPDLQLAEWYGEKFSESEQVNVERTLSMFCRTKQCEFIREKATFKCTGSSQKTRPFSTVNLLLLDLILLSNFWRN